MFTKYVLPLVAVVGFGYAVYAVAFASRPPKSVPVMEPPVRPSGYKSIAGAGLVEARAENIPIGAPTAGVVWEVFVKPEQMVKKGDPLFRLDDRALRSEFKVREAMLASAEAQLHKLEAAPRPEDVPVAEALVAEAEARLASAEINASRTARLYERSVSPASDYDRDRYLAAEARATLARNAADLKRLKAGSWKEDLDIAHAAVEQARSQLESTRIDLERLTVRALTDGRVLQVNVRLGQFAAMAWREPMIVLGDVTRLNVRVDIDEQDLPLFKPGARAVATLKGRPNARFALKFVRVEPYVIPKQSLTGDNSERVDTRVLQVIYELPDKMPIPVYVGQQMDVYLEAA
jgi:HlyD family secretion protein